MKVAAKPAANALLGLVALLIGLLLSLIVLEAGVRIAFHRGMNFDIEMWKYAREIKRIAGVEAIGHEHTPGSRAFLMGVEVVINDKKLRDVAMDYAPPPGERRILMLGDSLTFGWGVAEELTTSTLLENLLNDDPKRGANRFQVINTGVGNYNTAMEVAYFLHEGYRYKPELVVLNHFINDAEPTPRRRQSVLLDHFQAAVFLAGRFDLLKRNYFGGGNWASYYRDLYRPDAPGLKQAEESLLRLGERCRQLAIPLMIVHSPELHELQPYRFPEARQWLASQAGALGATFVDLLPAVEKEKAESLWVTPGDAHPNGRANRLYARVLFEAVTPYFFKMF
ncbi:MAG: SGNH/GDSL hydrolase family protein [Magnetococcales bacterium]|nr:SGNH/GDSL hydrolase family protein [Magnetococcales bacterium]